MYRPRTRALAVPSTLDTCWKSLADLKTTGATSADVEIAVRTGALVRVRRGRYLRGETHQDVIRAASLGGTLGCVSLLRLLGVFVEEHTAFHIDIDRGSSRLPDAPSGVVRHWRVRAVPRNATLTDVVTALACAVRCQPPRAAIATLDSALHHGVIDPDQLAEVFELLPRRHRRLRGLLDARCESGPETFLRLMLRSLGVSFEVQVGIEGVGFVDFLIDGWLIVECDSEAHHSDWRSRKRDIRRDRAAVRLGYTPVRFLAEEILYHPDEVLRELRVLIARNT